MSTQFDLEQRIMQCWDIIDDIDMLYTNVLDAPEKLTEDQIANILLGMKQLYDLKFNTLFSTFEKFLKEKHNEKTSNPTSPVVPF